MSTPNDKKVVRIQLTREQKEKLEAQTGKNADVIELTVEELEARIAPRLVANHNQTLLRDSAR